MYERVPTLRPSPSSLHEYIVERSTVNGAFEEFRFTVMGKGEFPWDMLRTDQAFPATTEDAFAMPKPLDEEGRRMLRAVTLVTRTNRAHWLPTFDRWRSFGWMVKTTAWEGR